MFSQRQNIYHERMIFRRAHRRIVILLLSLYLAALAVAVGGPFIRQPIDKLVFSGHEQHLVQAAASSHHGCWTSKYLLGCLLCSGVPVAHAHPHDAAPVAHELSYFWHLPQSQPAYRALVRARPPARGPPLLA